MSDRLIDAFVIAREISSKITQSAYPVPLIDGVLPAISGMLTSESPYSIKIERSDEDSHEIMAMLHRYQSSANVIYGKNLNVCWSRFVICKELVHLALDSEPSHYTKDVLGLIHGLINNVDLLSLDDELGSEKVAFITAVEVLLPWKLRGELYKMDADGLPDKDIACKWRVPEKIVSFLLRSSFRAFSEKANQLKA